MRINYCLLIAVLVVASNTLTNKARNYRTAKAVALVSEGCQIDPGLGLHVILPHSGNSITTVIFKKPGESRYCGIHSASIVNGTLICIEDVFDGKVTRTIWM